MLPSIKITLPMLILFWCVGAVWAFGSPVMLAYPAMWAAVAVLFIAATKLTAAGDAS